MRFIDGQFFCFGGCGLLLYDLMMGLSWMWMVLRDERLIFGEK